MLVSSQRSSPRSSYRFGAEARNEDGDRIPYFGPSDGLSHPSLLAQRLLKPIVRGLISSNYKIEVEGSENIPSPDEGPVVFAPTHPSIFDPPMMSLAVHGDVRYMADIGLFKNKLAAKVLSWAGAYPVDRQAPSPVTINHGADLLRAGASLCIFPEGGIGESHLRGEIGKLKEGAAFAAIQGCASSVVPVALNYEPDTRPHKVARLLAAGAGVSLAVATALSVSLPVTVGGLAMVASGALAVGTERWRKARQETPSTWYNIAPKVTAGMREGLKGAVAGGAAAGMLRVALGCCLPAPVSLACQAAVGVLGGRGLSKALHAVIFRERARIRFGKPIPVEPFRHQKDGRRELTIKLHQELGKLKSELSGVPHRIDKDPILKGFLRHSRVASGTATVGEAPTRLAVTEISPVIENDTSLRIDGDGSEL
jgi:1-acyl-sn-glycerol-3-phosphate acyltransferase